MPQLDIVSYTHTLYFLSGFFILVYIYISTTLTPLLFLNHFINVIYLSSTKLFSYTFLKARTFFIDPSIISNLLKTPFFNYKKDYALDSSVLTKSHPFVILAFSPEPFIISLGLFLILSQLPLLFTNAEAYSSLLLASGILVLLSGVFL